jgi:hypothetical protein
MRWRDIRFEKPTEADSDGNSRILQRLTNGSVVSWFWDNHADCIAWMPISEIPAFDPIPDPPEGWRFVAKGEAFDPRAKFWSKTSGSWLLTGHSGDYSKVYTYIVPIDPPEPQYRPYNAAELKQTIGKLVDGVSGYRAMITGACGDSVYCQGQRVPSDQLLKNHAWTDGGKCGVKVEPFEP